MCRIFAISSLALASVFGLSAPAPADVFIRAPFVRVAVGGGGVDVRAPFVNVSVPRSVSYQPPILPPGAQPLLPPAAQPLPVIPGPNQPIPGQPPLLPPPTPVPGSNLQMPTPIPAMTLRQFADCFNGGCGQHEAVLINPCTCQPCVVRFCLPGCPRRVTCGRNEVVFHYGLLKKVRIVFDGHGAHVVGRGV